MATAPVKPPLHNFALSFLKWGTTNQAAASSHRLRRPASAEPHIHSSEPDNSESELAHSNVHHGNKDRDRAGSSSRPARHHLRPLIHCADATAKRGRSEERENDDEEAVQRPWNLRPRRAPAPPAAFAKAGGANGSGSVVTGAGPASGERQEREGPNPNPNPNEGGHHQQQQQAKSRRLRGGGEGGQNGEKRKFWIALSKEEIEEDIFIMTGSRPARRPKKRNKIVQKQLDNIFPGLWLVGYTADAYHADSPPKR